MNHGVPSPLAAWQNFYVIIGSAAGALTGLQFVVMTLITQAGAAASMQEIRAFGTPTIVHFCAALLISAIMTAPWPWTPNLGICLGVCATAGVVYCTRIFTHARRAAYNPDLEDWIWYAAIPLVAHIALLVAGVLIWFNIPWSFDAVAADALLFIIVGIHNSWDTVTYIAVKHGAPSPGSEPDSDS